jgi:hypothetical protein
MKKIKLSLDNLAVESFSTDEASTWSGTVAAHLDTVAECNTNSPTVCTCPNPCTSDGYATIDAVLCAQSLGTGCGSEQTFTCKPTGFCCGPPTLDRYSGRS